MPAREVPWWLGALLGFVLATALFMAMAAFILALDTKGDINEMKREVESLEETMQADHIWVVDLKATLRTQKENDDEPNTRRTP